MPPHEFLSLKMVAEYLGTSQEHVKNLILASSFPPASLTSGNKKFWRRQLIDQWLADHRSSTPTTTYAPAETENGTEDQMKKILREAMKQLEPLGYQLQNTNSKTKYKFTHPHGLRPVTISSSPHDPDNAVRNAVSFAKKQIERTHPGWDFLDHLWRKYDIPSDGYRDVRMNLQQEAQDWLRAHKEVRSTLLSITSFARSIGYLGVLQRGGAGTPSLYRLEGEHYSPDEVEDVSPAAEAAVEAEPQPEPEPEPEYAAQPVEAEEPEELPEIVEPPTPRPVGRPPVETRAGLPYEYPAPERKATPEPVSAPVPGAVLPLELMGQLRSALFPGLDEQNTALELVHEEIGLMIGRAESERQVVAGLLDDIDRRLNQLQDLQRLTRRIAGEDR